jgi:hypothetical protein
MGYVSSAADVKSNLSSAKRNVPKEGTKTRELYNLFMSNKGKVIDIDFGDRTQMNWRIKENLMDFYGLDIRSFGRKKWCLVGEWDGRAYIDYMSQTQ